MLFVLVALAAAPVHIESLGFTVEVAGDAVNVIEVTPGSSAAAAGLTPGLRIERVFQPTYMFARGPLTKLSESDLHDALTISHDEPLVFVGSLDGKKKNFTLNRTDPRPPPLTGPLPMEKVKRLSMIGQAQYYAKLPALLQQGRPAPTLRAPLSYSSQVTAELSPRGVHRVINGAATPDWIYLDDMVAFSCPSSPMRSIELVSVAPVKKVLATSTNKALRGASIAAQIPMWRVKDAREACKRGQSRLPSVELTATVRCEGAEPLSVPFAVTLGLECLSEPPASESRLDALRVRSRETVLVGSADKTKLAVHWRWLRPTPLEATVVALDDKGRVETRFQTVPPGDESEPVELEVALDTSKERKVQLGLELRFPDGSVGLTPLQAVNVASKEKVARAEKEFADLSAKSQAVLTRMGKQFKDPCAAPDETVKWLRAQPEVAIATNHEGHNLSFTVGWLPFMVNCHHP